MSFYKTSLDTLAAALAESMGIEPPKQAAAPCTALTEYVENAFAGAKADRIFLYNPDAIGAWITEAYPALLREMIDRTELQIPFLTVMPSVTPVCFGTFYTGAQPAIHGIQTYAKPVITIDTLFDTLIRAGRKPAIVAEAHCSIAEIFLNREMDYFIYPTIAEVNAKAAELIVEDSYDLIVVYNGNYDTVMHRHGPEGLEALCELKANAQAYATFDALIRTHWKAHNSLVGFAMDHGCHAIDGGCGSHGLEMPEDLNVLHFYKAYPKV